MTAPDTESLYRCAECGHGKHLAALAAATVYGSLDADGHLTEASWDEEDHLHEDSITCTKHADAVIEKHVGGVWCRWWICPWCQGDGKPCSHAQTHAGWRPTAEIARLPALPGAGAGHIFDLKPGQRGINTTCRVCTALASSINGGNPCRGDQHTCPAAVPEGTTGAEQMWGREDWFCYQPGQMNGDFTAWTCRAGHVTTRATHDHQRGQCVIPRGCPWADLVPEPAERRQR